MNWNRNALPLLAGAISFVLTAPTFAGFVGLKTVTKETGIIPGLGELFVCNVYAVFDRPDDEVVAVAGVNLGHPLNIFVKQGKFYQDPEGTITPAFLQLLSGASGALAFDTFVTIGAKVDDLFTMADNVSTTPGLGFANCCGCGRVRRRRGRAVGAALGRI